MDTKSVRSGYQIFAGYQIRKVDTKQAARIPNWGLFGILGCHLATLTQTTAKMATIYTAKRASSKEKRTFSQTVSNSLRNVTKQAVTLGGRARTFSKLT